MNIDGIATDKLTMKNLKLVIESTFSAFPFKNHMKRYITVENVHSSVKFGVTRISN